MDDYGDEDTSPIWRKIDQLNRELRETSKEQAVIKQRQDDHERRHEYMITALTEVKTELKMLNENLNQAQGGLKLGKWLFWAAITVAGLVVAIWKVLTTKLGGF